MTSNANREQAEFWDESAASWIEAGERRDVIVAPFGRAAMEALDPKPGDAVVDIGCGTGDTTAALAAKVEPGGSALGVDISTEMVAEAKRRHAGVHNLGFTVADVQVDDLGGRRFAGAFSQFGIMFFADPAAAFANIRSLLAPSGRLAFCCWQDVFANEWMLLSGMAVTNVTGSLPPMPGPGEPGPFTLADPDVIKGLLTGAGFTDVDVTPLNVVIDQPESDIESFVALARRVGPIREAIHAADDEHFTDRLLAAAREILHDKVSAGRLQMTSGANIVSARA
jgi:SAM-dependent methyltransferase